MTSNVLRKIVDNKKREVEARKKTRPIERLKNGLTKSPRSLEESLSNDSADFIFECKKASPSKGLLKENFDLDEILLSYKKYASAISVLTDFTFFQGSFEHLNKVCRSVEQPVLCKDFFIDEYQVYEARYHGADAILLMLSVLNDVEYKLLADVAKKLNLDVLTEVHDSEEMHRALALDARIIGINNRNLKDLSIDLATTKNLTSQLTKRDQQGRLFISESGITTHEDVQHLSPLVNGFLVGSSLMENDDLSHQCKSLIYGKVKVCGLLNNESALHAEKMGACYGGLIFHKKSPRHTSLHQAKETMKDVSMDFVGVFVDEPLDSLLEVSMDLDLSIIQLHGSEDESYISDIKNRLAGTKIWKAIAAKNQQYVVQQLDRYLPIVDKILIDTHSKEKSGGVGESFDWNLLEHLPKNKIILAGGLKQSNIKQAQDLATFALDVNSGVEDKPGIKSNSMITSLFGTIKA